MSKANDVNKNIKAKDVINLPIKNCDGDKS
jgi:hypothetical protein